MKTIYASVDHGRYEHGGITEPRKIEATDGKIYAVKFASTDEPNSNYNEWLGSLLALELKVEVLEPFVMIFDMDFISNSREIREKGINAGSYFATLFYDDKYNLSDYNEDASTITNLEAVNSFITFDIFICNSDRHRRNTMLIPNSKGSGSYYKYVLIDHGRCFNIVDGDLPYIDTQIHWNTSEVNSKRLRKRSEYMIGRVTSSLVKRILTKISRYATHQNDVGVLQNVLINRGAGDIMQIIDKHHRHLLGGQ